MNLIKHEPNNIFAHLKHDMERMLSAFENWPSYFGEEESIVSGQWSPAVDIVEEDKQFIVRADVPGVDPKNIEVTMDNGFLTIKGERSREEKEERKGYRRVERFQGSFYRRFSMPDTADSENIKAKDKQGVLEIRIGKRAGSEPRKITVES